MFCTALVSGKRYFKDSAATVRCEDLSDCSRIRKPGLKFLEYTIGAFTFNTVLPADPL